MTPRVGSLFSGTGVMDLAVCEVLGATVAWHCETEPAANRVLAHHWPGVPNMGDIAAVDWAGVEPVDVLTGGFPCQDVSSAGMRTGMRPGTRSGLWSHMAYAIDVLRPRLVVIENVRGLLSADAACDLEPCPWCVGDDEGRPLRALGRVLGDLADLGFDARWCGLRATDVGAPHGRFRVFLTAWPAGDPDSPVGDQWWFSAPGQTEGGGPRSHAGGSSGAPAADAGSERRVRWTAVSGDRRNTAVGSEAIHHARGGGVTAADPEGERRGEGPPESAGQLGGSDAALGRDAVVADTPGCGDPHQPGGCDAEGLPVGAVTGPGTGGGPGRAAAGVHELGGDAPLVAWGDYGPAVRRGIDEPSDRTTGMLGRYDMRDRGLSDKATCSGDVQEALRPMEDDGRSDGGEGGRPQAETSGGTVLGEGEEDGDLLALDGRVSEPLGSWEIHGVSASQREGSPLGVRASRWADPAGTDAGPPVPSTGVCESSPSGACDVGGERTQAGRSRLAVSTGSSPVGGEPLSRPEEGLPPLPPLPEAARSESQGASSIEWGSYGPAIAQWELILGRPAPAPTQTGTRGGRQLSPPFVEWLMGLPAGWVTDVPGLSRNEQLKLLGNGVVPQQCAAAVRGLLQIGASRSVYDEELRA